MRSRDVRVYLEDVLRACGAIMRFVDGYDLDAYCADMKTRSAVERQFEIIGEALGQARLVDAGLVDTIDSARAIVGFRNRLIHGYALVDDEIVWGNIERVPELTEAVHRALRRT